MISLLFLFGREARSQTYQDFRHLQGWHNLTKTTFDGLSIEPEKVLVITAKEAAALSYSSASTNGYAGKIYMDRAGNNYYWVNASYGKVVIQEAYRPRQETYASQSSRDAASSEWRAKASKALTQVTITDSTTYAHEQKFLSEVASGFSTVFIVKPPYTVHPITKEEIFVYGFWSEGPIFIDGRRNIVLKEIDTQSEYFIEDNTKTKSSLSYLLTCLFEAETIKQALDVFLWENGKLGGIGANTKFLEPYFSQMIPQASRTYPKFVPMPVDQYNAMVDAVKKFKVKTSGDTADMGEKTITVNK
jgi:hypothetical protein